MDLHDVIVADLAADHLRAAAARHRAGVRSEPRARGGAGRPLRAAAGPAQPGDQCGAGGERAGAGKATADHALDQRGPRARRSCGCATAGPACPSTWCRICLPRSSRPRRPGEGTGLGLSLSYGLVKAHGGVLEYEASPQGRCRVPGHPARCSSRSSPSRPRPGRDAENGRSVERRILVVDEDPAVHRLLNALFTPEGHAVEAVRTGEQGLRLARERDFDLIIADVRVAAGPAELFAGPCSRPAPARAAGWSWPAPARRSSPRPWPSAPVHRVTEAVQPSRSENRRQRDPSVAGRGWPASRA